MTLYPLTDEMREKYPDESVRWENLVTKAGDPQHRGCYTCKFYTPIPEEKFPDIESLDDDVDKDWLSWDTEKAWVYCSKFPNNDTSLRIGCDKWQVSDEYR